MSICMYVVDIFPSFGSFNFWPLNVPQRPDLATGTAGITDNRNKNNPEKYGHKKRQQCFYKTSFLTSFFFCQSAWVFQSFQCNLKAVFLHHKQY